MAAEKEQIPTVGEVRALLARHGVPHADDTHYAIVAVAGALGPLAILGCCDSTLEAVQLLSAALASLTGDGCELAPGSPSVIVSRSDLISVLAEAEGFIGDKYGTPFGRLAAAAGVE